MKFITLCAIFFSVHTSFAETKPTPPEKTEAWKAEMRRMASSLEELVFDLNSDARFNDKKNFKRIESNAEALGKIATHIDKMSEDPKADPSLKVIAGVFSSEAKHGIRTLQSGHRAYARDVLKSLT